MKSILSLPLNCSLMFCLTSIIARSAMRLEKVLVIQDNLELNLQGTLVALANNSHSASSTAHFRAGLFGGSGGDDDDPSRRRGGGRSRGSAGGRRVGQRQPGRWKIKLP